MKCFLFLFYFIDSAFKSGLAIQRKVCVMLLLCYFFTWAGLACLFFFNNKSRSYTRPDHPMHFRRSSTMAETKAILSYVTALFHFVNLTNNANPLVLFCFVCKFSWIPDWIEYKEELD